MSYAYAYLYISCELQFRLPIEQAEALGFQNLLSIWNKLRQWLENSQVRGSFRQLQPCCRERRFEYTNMNSEPARRARKTEQESWSLTLTRRVMSLSALCFITSLQGLVHLNVLQPAHLNSCVWISAQTSTSWFHFHFHQTTKPWTFFLSKHLIRGPERKNIVILTLAESLRSHSTTLR